MRTSAAVVLTLLAAPVVSKRAAEAMAIPGWRASAGGSTAPPELELWLESDDDFRTDLGFELRWADGGLRHLARARPHLLVTTWKHLPAGLMTVTKVPHDEDVPVLEVRIDPHWTLPSPARVVGYMWLVPGERGPACSTVESGTLRIFLDRRVVGLELTGDNGAGPERAVAFRCSDGIACVDLRPGLLIDRATLYEPRETDDPAPLRDLATLRSRLQRLVVVDADGTRRPLEGSLAGLIELDVAQEELMHQFAQADRPSPGQAGMRVAAMFLLALGLLRWGRWRRGPNGVTVI